MNKTKIFMLSALSALMVGTTGCMEQNRETFYNHFSNYDELKLGAVYTIDVGESREFYVRLKQDKVYTFSIVEQDAKAYIKICYYNGGGAKFSEFASGNLRDKTTIQPSFEDFYYVYVSCADTEPEPISFSLKLEK